MTTEEVIDRTSPVPYYQQLVDVLEKRLESGRIALGERLPSEKELGTEFGLARATVRQALQALEARGLVQRIANRGVFASKPAAHQSWTIQGPEGFLENAIGHQNRSVTTQVLRHGQVTLPAAAAHSLGLPEGTSGFELVRVRSLDGTPALFSTNYSPPAIAALVAQAPDVLAGTASFSELLSSAGYSLGGAHRTIYAASPTAEIAEALGISAAVPLLRIRSVSWTRAGVKYDLYETWVHSDVVPLEVDVDVAPVDAASAQP